MSLSWRIARRELRGGVKGFRVFLLCLMLGVAAIAAVGLVRGAIRGALSDQGAILLGGDVEYELTYRRATPEERDWITSRSTAVSEIVEFRSMLGGSGANAGRMLTQVKAVDGAHPLLGAVQLDPPVGMQALDVVDDMPGIFLAPALADRLNLRIGDRVNLGGLDFAFRARLIREPDETGGGIGLGPPSMVGLAQIEGTRLLAPGALFETEYRAQVAPGTDLDALRTEARAFFDGKGMRWSDLRRASPGADRFVNRLGSFLVLVGLAGLAVGGVGISATVNAWIARKAETIATLRAMGAESATIRWVFLWQILVLGIAGIVAGLALAVAVVLGLSGLIEASLPIPVQIGLRPIPLFEAALYGALVAAIFALWPIARMSGQRAARLYRDTDRRKRGVPGKAAMALIAGLVLILVVSAGAFSGLWLLTFGTLGGIVLALVVLLAAATGLKGLARWGAGRVRGYPVVHTALAAIGGPRSEAVAVILSLGLGLSVLAAVGQVDNGLRRAIAEDLPAEAPAFFVIDIQPDQLDPFMARMQAIEGVRKIETTPMMRGVVTQINGAPAREGRPDHWVLRGDRGVTYAATPRERITEGTFWRQDYSGDPQISFAAEEAKEIGLKLGDRLTVNILGRDIEAPITSFRDVDFATGGIGFVITFNPTALQGAPHTHLATVYAPPQAEADILRALGEEFPNITAIGVRDAVDRMSEALATIARATSLAAGVTLITGFVVLIGAAAAGEGARAWEAALLKTLGATRRTILLSFALRAALMGAAAGVVAIIFGGLAGYAVVEWVMGAQFHFALIPAVVIVLGGVIAVLAAGLIFALRPLSQRPAGILRARD
ncbi:drug:proton antiporter [Thioclava sp. SK-1]|uniref:ABC transporter permease n=1 Tax=Thioclava sp. SK-1 TaxID=1889770 RepID=UPI0008258F45|nr:FtsX-like permease family protein [Thioclava sp. SK-1]OCX66650.1 drug:proton antiporter [Thioclava sp. SK-1]